MVTTYSSSLQLHKFPLELVTYDTQVSETNVCLQVVGQTLKLDTQN